MRIAYVCADPGVPVFGAKGCSVHVQEVIRAFRRSGAAVELFAARTGGDRPTDLSDLRFHAMPSARRGDLAARERAALAANGPLADALRAAGPFDLVYERYSLWSYAAMDHARSVGAAGVLEVNAPLIAEQTAYRGLCDRGAAERVARRVFNAAGALVAVSAAVADYLAGFPDNAGRVFVIPNGVDLARFPPATRPTDSCPSHSLTVGFVGTLKPWHGVPILLDAFDRLHARRPGARLLIVGDGPERESIVGDLAARGLTGKVRLTGAVPPDAVPGFLASMDVAVAPYPPRENFYFSPLKVVEAMAAGRPVVASAIGQITALIDDGVNGLLVPPGDPAALADALERLARDVALRQRLGRSARDAVCRRYTWDAVVRRVYRLAETTSGVGA
jgi:glycosyltransferase involved in cell wall biosynthesis